MVVIEHFDSFREVKGLQVYSKTVCITVRLSLMMVKPGGQFLIPVLSNLCSEAYDFVHLVEDSNTGGPNVRME